VYPHVSAAVPVDRQSAPIPVNFFTRTTVISQA